MNDRRAPKLTFDSVVDPDGLIRVPADVQREIKSRKVRVVLTEERIARALIAAGVTEADVERIAARQMESREHVLRFLIAEGSAPRYGTRRRGRT